MNKPNLLIIPDVHGRDFWKDAIHRHTDCEIIFLGDYLDPYPDEGVSEPQAWQGMKEIISLKKGYPSQVTLLWGNHHLHYLYPELMGNRYDYRKMTGMRITCGTTRGNN